MRLCDRIERFSRPDLYVVITGAFCAGRDPLHVLDAVLRAGVRLVQFREKGLDGGELLRRAMAFREHTAQADALLIINDRVDIALACNADGVHLGQSDLPIEAARSIAPELLIGASAHNLEEALAAQAAGAGYVNLGPVFTTQTKDVPTGAIGPEALERIAPQLHLPWTTMGGIKAHNLSEVLRRGAQRVAVVTAVTEAEDVEEAARSLRDIIVAHHEGNQP